MHVVLKLYLQVVRDETDALSDLHTLVNQRVYGLSPVARTTAKVKQFRSCRPYIVARGLLMVTATGIRDCNDATFYK